MRLEAGTRIGAYEVGRALGAGGMGEVYRARDTKLNRDVAIKILPDVFAGDEMSLSRLRREAQTLASLNHPNIAQIYGLEEQNGICALVMEFVEGDELTSRISRGPVPLEDAIPLARQIAEALEAAHEKSIVHRDLKPANIKETSGDKIKLLDFGLATPLSDQAHALQNRDLSQSPTMAKLSEPGMILGTAAYMSPEQARGKPVDKRSDIWAFGVVLFEMLSGRKLFRGETLSDVLAAVLRQDIEWSALPPSTPDSITRLLRRCLERDPNQRLRDIGEARIVLSHPIETPAVQAKTISTRPGRNALWLILLAAFTIAGFAAGKYFLPKENAAESENPAAATSAAEAFTLLTDHSGVESAPSLSPDGRDLAYVKETNGQQDIYVVRVGGRNALNLTADSPDDDDSPAFSPDGETIAFHSARSGGGIFLMGSTGESVRRLTSDGFTPSWSPDGKQIVMSTDTFFLPQDRMGSSKLVTVDVATGKRKEITAKGDAIQPSWSPHGQRIAFWGLRTDTGRRDIWTIAADGSETQTEGVAVTDDSAMDWSPTWSPDGKYLYFSSNRGGTLNLWRVPIDEATGQLRGKIEPVTVPSGWAGHPSFSRDGKHLAFSTLEWRSRLFKLPLDPGAGKTSGPPVSILESSYPIRDNALSPDGKWIAYTAFVGGQEDLFVVDINGSNVRRLSEDPNRERGPGWTPDGTQIAFYSDRNGGYQMWFIGLDGSGLSQYTTDFNSFSHMPTFSPDGKQIAARAPFITWGIWDRAAKKLTKYDEPGTGRAFWPFSWSSDGQLLVGNLMGGGGVLSGISTYSLKDRSYKFLTGAKTVGTWSCQVWLNDSRRLLYRDRRGIHLYNMDTDSSSLLHPVGGYYVAKSIGISSDNRTISFTETATQGDIWLMNLTGR